MERSQGNGAATAAQHRSHRATAEALAFLLLEDVEAGGRPTLHWPELIETALVAAVQAERSRWLSRIEGLRSKAREQVT